MTILVADQTYTNEVDRAPLDSQQNTGWKQWHGKKNNSDQKLETTYGPTFIWPQENWMVICNTGRCQ